MKRAAASLVIAAGLLALAAIWAASRPARRTLPPPATEGAAAQAQAAVNPDPAAPLRARAPEAAAAPGPASYLEQLAAARREFDTEARDEAWAARAEAELRAAVLGGLSARAVALRDDLKVECRTDHCRLSVPIPPGFGIASLPVATEMADALQRGAPAVAAIGRIVGENAEPRDPAQKRRFAVYLRRNEATPAP